MTEPTRRSRSLLLAALLVAAALGVPGAIFLASHWASEVEEITVIAPDQFRSQGLAWGVYCREILENAGRPAGVSAVGMVDDYAVSAFQALQEAFRAHPESTPLEVAVYDLRHSEPILAFPRRFGSPPPGPEAFRSFEKLRLEVAHASGERSTDVFVTGPIRPTALPFEYSMRCVLRFDHPQALEIRGKNFYFAIIGGVFLFLLYVIFTAIYVLGRGEVSQLFRTKEKEIRLRAMGQVAEGIAHEVRNPLNAVSLMVQYLERLPEKSGARPGPDDFQRVYLELGKIRKVIDNFVSFAKLREIELTEWDAGELVDETVRHFEPLIAEIGIEIRRESRGDLRVTADRAKIAQVLRSIVENAVEAVRDAPAKELFITAIEGKANVTVAVRDSGEALPEKMFENMFDPFVSTRPSAMGLGLTIARTVVESHGGTIQAAAARPNGCVVTMNLPKSF